jgi:hypothetical protein
MSRHGYSEDCDDDLAAGRWAGQLASAIRGKRGQAFLRELIDALDTMPEKRLIRGALREDGEVCALGALGAKRGLDLESLDPDEPEDIGVVFGIAQQLAREVVWQNDEICDRGTPEERWRDMRGWAQRKLKAQVPVQTLPEEGSKK